MKHQLTPPTTPDPDPSAPSPAPAATEQRRALAWQLTVAEQRERRRFATELHDDLAQILVVCKMKLGMVMETVPGQAAEALAEIGGLLDNSLERARTMVAQLSPTVLYDAGLGTAVQWLVRHMQRYGLVVDVKEYAPADVMALPIDRATVFFQAIQELLFNVAQHAGVRHATLTLQRRHGDLTATITDEGAGFDGSTWDAAPTLAGGYGLFNVRERLTAAGGTFRIDTTRGRGTRVTLSVPLPASEARHESAAAPQPEQRPPLPPPPAERPDADRASEDRPAGSAPAAAPEARDQASAPAPDRLRILLADDHAIVRRGLRMVIEAQPDFRVIGEAADGPEAIELAGRLHPDVVMLDVSMPGMTGIEVARRISQTAPDVHLIGLSVHDDPGLAAAMRHAGAACYLTKGGPLDELYSAIRAARNAPVPEVGIGS